MTSSIRRALAVRSLLCASVTEPSLGGHRPASENLFRMQKRGCSPDLLPVHPDQRIRAEPVQGRVQGPGHSLSRPPEISATSEMIP